MKVLSARQHGAGRAVVEIEGVETIEMAETLRDGTMLRERASSMPPPEGSFYAQDLLGLQVVTVGGESLGRVAEIRETGGTDLLVVPSGGREILIPFARAICTEIDLAGGRIVVDPPEGLLDLP